MIYGWSYYVQNSINNLSKGQFKYCHLQSFEADLHY
jgi:hypothetical protein